MIYREICVDYFSFSALSSSFCKTESPAPLNTSTNQSINQSIPHLVRVLWEELVFLEQVLDHAEEHVGLPLHAAGLELSENICGDDCVKHETQCR